jgi:Arc/MetJ family transcription regulator
MARGRSVEDVNMLEMALIGFQIEKQRIESRIQDIQSQLKGKRAATPSAGPGETKAPVRRELSEGARKRIAAAQKRRWAEHRKRAAQAAKTSGTAT